MIPKNMKDTWTMEDAEVKMKFVDAFNILLTLIDFNEEERCRTIAASIFTSTGGNPKTLKLYIDQFFGGNFKFKKAKYYEQLKTIFGSIVIP